MKAYFLPLGSGADRSLPAMLTAVSCGAVREVPEMSIFRVSAVPPDPLAESMAADLNACRRYFAGKDAFAFFRTSWIFQSWQPVLPERGALVEGETAELLLTALRGKNQPLSYRTDAEAVAWAFSALLDEMPEDLAQSAPLSPSLLPFLEIIRNIQRDLDAGEDVRILLFCDLDEGYAAGLALGLLRFLRARFGGRSPFLGLIGQSRPMGISASESLSSLRSFLTVLRDRELVRPSEDRATLGADAFWLLGLPSGLLTTAESGKILDWAAARILGEVFGSSRRPSPGLHTRELPGILTLQALDQEARPAAAFLRGACWCLCDLFPALHAYFDHPTLLRSLAPATRNGLFRRVFRDGGQPEELALVERALRAMLLEILTLLRFLPAPLREAEQSSALWQEAVRACGRAVTLGAEFDVSRAEAAESGVDKVAPVHRVSMADTEEEEALRKLERMEADLRQLNADRADVFEKMGGFRARQVLEDCLHRCRTAEVSAREKLAVMPADGPEERYALGLQERRTRMLRAAVLRSEREIEELSRSENLSRPGTSAPSSPFAGEILNPAMAEHAFQLLTSEGEAAESAEKALREGLGSLFPGETMNDGKILLKNLLAISRRPDSEAPLRGLMAGVFSVCGVEVSGIRFLSVGDVPAVPLLPDLRDGDRFLTLSAAPERLLAAAPRDRTAEIRGLLAFLLLREYRRRSGDEAELSFLPFDRETSALCRSFLVSRGASRGTLVCLRREAGEHPALCPLAVLLPGAWPEPARLSGCDPDLFPAFVLWLDRESLLFRDPCSCLSEGDRRVLTEQLTRLRAVLKTPESRPFADFLIAWHQDIVQAARKSGPDDLLPQRLKAACGLFRLPAWKKELQRISVFYEPSLSGDPVCAALCGAETFDAASCPVREEILYCFRDRPIARENASVLLESAGIPEERHLLSSLGAECEILLQSSDDYHEALSAGLEALLARFPAADPAAREAAETALAEARAPLKEAVTEFAWPWDTVSASILTILTECLGPDLAGAALSPFSDRLVLFPARGGEVIGDQLFSSLCLLRREAGNAQEAAAVSAAPAPAGSPEGDGGAAWGPPDPARSADSAAEDPAPDAASPVFSGSAPAAAPDAVLPPLSRDFARMLCREPLGQRLLQDDFLSFSAESGGVRAVLTLKGAFTLRLSRLYPPEEQLPLYAHDLPTLAVWPGLPFAAEDWRAYFSYAHAPEELDFEVVTRDGEATLEGLPPRRAVRTEGFPLCFLLSRDGVSLGALPNLLPSPDLPAGGAWTASVDFGASAASIVFSDGTARFPMQGPVRVRTLLRNPAATDRLLWQEFLPAVPVSALLPATLRFFRNDPAEAALPLRDASIFMSGSLLDVLDAPSASLYADLKWHGGKGLSGRLCLHQMMLMAALEARCGGASSLCWRAAVPDEMAPEGRERLTELFRTLAEEVRSESGLPFPEKAPPVAFASESAALGAYFRFCASDETRGGFMALDLGADTADLSLFLRGREQAERTCQLPLGIHYMLLPALLRRPSLLEEDFGVWEDAAFLQELARLRALLEKAARDPAALRHARCGLDALISDRFPLLLQIMSARRAEGAPCRTGALLLLYFSFLMMLGGLTLLQISVDSLRNDFLPESMALFLGGRGAALMEALSLPVKTSLWKILTMFRNPRVSSLNLLFSAEKKLEIPVGLSVLGDVTAALPRPAQVPVSMALRPEELMPEFLLRFRREFPGEAELLFPGLYGTRFDEPFSPWGRDLISQALGSAFGAREAGRPYPALVDCLNHLMELILESGGH